MYNLLSHMAVGFICLIVGFTAKITVITYHGSNLNRALQNIACVANGGVYMYSSATKLTCKDGTVIEKLQWKSIRGTSVIEELEKVKKEIEDAQVY